MIRTCCTQEHMNFSWLVTLAPCFSSCDEVEDVAGGLELNTRAVGR